MLTDRFVFYTGGSDTEERPGYTGQTCEKNDSTVSLLLLQEPFSSHILDNKNTRINDRM
jgi:hypothetical protein